VPAHDSLHAGCCLVDLSLRGWNETHLACATFILRPSAKARACCAAPQSSRARPHAAQCCARAQVLPSLTARRSCGCTGSPRSRPRCCRARRAPGRAPMPGHAYRLISVLLAASRHLSAAPTRHRAAIATSGCCPEPAAFACPVLWVVMRRIVRTRIYQATIYYTAQRCC